MSEKTITELAKSSALFSATTRLTAKKTDELISRGMAITGFVLTNLATNDKSTVDLGRVNWHPVTEAGRNEPINAELLSAAKTAEKWLQSWLDEKLCECEGYHYCGRTEREAELAQIKTAIRNAMGNGRMSDQTPACSICTTTAWTQDELQPLPIRLHRATIIDLCPDCLDALSKHISALRSVAGRAMRTGLPKQVKETK